MLNSKSSWMGVGLLLIATLVPRLLSLGTTLTVDEPLWQSRAGTFIRAFSIGDFAHTLVAGQPGVTTTWIVGLASFSNSLAMEQGAVATVTSLLVFFITYFLVQLWGFRWGMTGGFLLALNPFLIAHSRLVHTDALLSLFYVASFVVLLTALEPLHNKKPPVRRYIVASAVLAAGALLTKMFALLLLPTGFVLFIVTFFQTKYSWREAARPMLLWGGIFIVTMFIAWPALWGHADSVYHYLFSRVELHAEGTRSQETTTAWWYYAREGMFRLTAATTILLPFSFLSLSRKSSDPMRRISFWLLFAGLAYALALSTSADKSDRYILASLVMFTLLAVPGLRLVSSWIQKEWKTARFARYVPTIIVLAWLVFELAKLHPYYLAHYNRLYPIEATHKLGWGEGLEQAAQWISEHDPGASVSAYYARVFEYFYNGPVDSTSHVDSKDYLVLYRSMFERGPGQPDTELLNEYLYSNQHHPVHTVTINNLPYAWILKLN